MQALGGIKVVSKSSTFHFTHFNIYLCHMVWGEQQNTQEVRKHPEYFVALTFQCSQLIIIHHIVQIDKLQTKFLPHRKNTTYLGLFRKEDNYFEIRFAQHCWWYLFLLQIPMENNGKIFNFKRQWNYVKRINQPISQWLNGQGYLRAQVNIVPAKVSIVPAKVNIVPAKLSRVQAKVSCQV